MTTPDTTALGCGPSPVDQLEQALVERDLRGMGKMRPALVPGYLQRAARMLLDSGPDVLIATGFPVLDTCETDGPVGAMALYRTCFALGKRPLLACEQPLAAALRPAHRVIDLPLPGAARTLEDALRGIQPQLLISIERPGAAADGRYYNMRGEDISARVASLDPWVAQLDCASIGMGDGGNELGMGNLGTALKALDIVPSTSRCSELIIADVSNWAAYGLVAMLGWLRQLDLLANIAPAELLQQLARHGIIDGVTRRAEPTEDGLPVEQGLALIARLRQMTGFG